MSREPRMRDREPATGSARRYGRSALLLLSFASGVADVLAVVALGGASPHLGYVTERTYATYYREAVEDIAAHLDGTPVRVLG
ncbi:hypothetical protein CLM82_27915 [Streptomyces albidoflavus]|nr:hypothetical protein CLM82_27915 [Streptomyces albidoflavus]